MWCSFLWASCILHYGRWYRFVDRRWNRDTDIRSFRHVRFLSGIKWECMHARSERAHPSRVVPTFSHVPDRHPICKLWEVPRVLSSSGRHRTCQWHSAPHREYILCTYMYILTKNTRAALEPIKNPLDMTQVGNSWNCDKRKMQLQFLCNCGLPHAPREIKRCDRRLFLDIHLMFSYKAGFVHYKELVS